MNPGTRKLVRRGIGLAIAAFLVWIVFQTVPFQDRLLVTFSKGESAVEWQGALQGPWQAEEVEFVVESTHKSTSPGHLEFTPGTHVRATSKSLGVAATRTEVFEAEWRPGLPRVFRELRWSALIPAMLLLVACTLLVITRWYWLLRAAGCPTHWIQVVRVTFVGLFFNLILPGVNGGDLARAYWMVKGHPERRAAALMSVFMDRLLGLFAMALLATVAIYTNDARMASLRLPVLAATLAMFFGGLILVNPWLRTHLPVGKMLDRLPASERFHALDAALQLYGSRPGAILLAVVLSLANHLGASGALYLLGHALGDTHDFHDYVCIAAVMNTLSAIPLSPGGLGVGEVLSGSLLRMAGGSYTIGVAASITYRLGLFLLGLLGGLVLLLPGGSALRQEWRQAEAEGVAPGALEPISND